MVNEVTLNTVRRRGVCPWGRPPGCGDVGASAAGAAPQVNDSADQAVQPSRSRLDRRWSVDVGVPSRSVTGVRNRCISSTEAAAIA
jgi:hypothetical protein